MEGAWACRMCLPKARGTYILESNNRLNLNQRKQPILGGT